MSQIPRRTSEFQSSVLRPSASARPSRIGMPSSALRPGPPRTSSTNLLTGMTPSRTPNRSRERTMFVPMTAEKEKAPVEDRAFVAEKTQQVLEALANQNDFRELVQKGLKSMTHKQFIMILQVFLKPIVGTTVNIDATNYVDYVHNLISSLEYPYSMNKSSLKTPSAPHCQNSIIILLAWLTEFVVYEADQDMIDYCATEEFESTDFTRKFMTKMSEAFVSWNNQESEEAKIEEMRHMYLNKKLGQGGNIATEIDRLKISIDQLQRESQPVSLMREIEEKSEELKQLKKKAKKLTRCNDDLSAKISHLGEELKMKEESNKKVKREICEWQQKISKQKMTHEQRNQLLMEITELKMMLESKQADVLELNEGSSAIEIQLSNLIQKKFHLIDKLNNSIYTLASDLQVSGMREKFDPALYEIKTTKLGNASALDTEIERLKRGLTELNLKYQHAIEVKTKFIVEHEAEEKQLTAELNLVTENANELKASLTKVAAEASKVEEEIKYFQQSSEQKFQQDTLKLEQMNITIGKLKRNIGTYENYIAQVEADIAEFKVRSIAECQSLTDKRKEEFEQKQKKLAELKTFLTEFAKAQKPMPENVEQIVKDVLKKRDLNNNGPRDT